MTCQNDPNIAVNVKQVHSLVLGSGAAGLCAAIRLRAEGIDDVRIVTEGLQSGTSINTGSDKQTYYKLSLCGDEPDSPVEMAKTYTQAGSMHGDLALVEAATSARAFLHLVNLGVPFPTDAFGQFVGYKTDHDPRCRATSIGPYTSREMCRALIRRVRELNIPVDEGENAVELLTIDDVDYENENSNRSIEKTDQKACPQRIAGVITVNASGNWTVYLTENLIFAVGGPGGLYETSVYPTVHSGAIGLALQIGAEASNLPESQFGLGSIKHRWNVSGTYMQVIPRVVSTDSDGISGSREFLVDYFDHVGEMCSQVFLKGYQWPFDSRKVLDKKSSLIDLLVYQETVLKKRRVFLDYRSNPAGLDFATLSEEATAYLKKSGVLSNRGDVIAETPIARLQKMNPAAIQLYLDHGIDLRSEMLEIALCHQHNNGGLAGTHWWESTNIKHLFPVGEVNGSHGVARPGGSALNAGQVGAFRAAEYIGHHYRNRTLDTERSMQKAKDALEHLTNWCKTSKQSHTTWQTARSELQRRMTHFGGPVRSQKEIAKAFVDAKRQYDQLLRDGCTFANDRELLEALRNRHLLLAGMIYLHAIGHAVESGVGSRGSAIVLEATGNNPICLIRSKIPEAVCGSPATKGVCAGPKATAHIGCGVHPKLDPLMHEMHWSMFPENEALRSQILVTHFSRETEMVDQHWQPCRPIPTSDLWFETAWAAYQNGEIYRTQYEE